MTSRENITSVRVVGPEVEASLSEARGWLVSILTYSGWKLVVWNV